MQRPRDFGEDKLKAKYSDTLGLDLDSVEPSIAGPKRPQDRIPLRSASAKFAKN